MAPKTNRKNPSDHPIAKKSLHAQEIAGHSETKLRMVIESAPYAMVLVNKKGEIIFVNVQTEKTFGYTQEELLGQTIEMLIPQQYRNKHTHERAVFNAHPSTRAMGAGRDLFGLRKDGSQIPVEIGLTAITSSPDPQVLASIIDITERKRMERERHRLEREVLEASEMERKRIGQELHDSLGQQLLGIAFLSSALKEKLHQKSLTETADAGHIASLIEKVMAQARGLSRELYAAELESQGLREALKQLAANINSTTNIHCYFDGGKNVVCEDKGKATHIYRIAQEALHNARRHSMATEIVVSLHTKENELRLSVKDNGIGLANTTPSTGMGLKLMRYRADIIGGSFLASTDRSGGTIISCTIPLHKTSITA